MNVSDSSIFSNISYENFKYNIVNSFIAKKFLLNRVRANHCSAAIYYILDYTLRKYFSKVIKVQKYRRDERLLPTYFN